jgi:hypothetical protein
MAKPQHKPSDENRKTVKAMTAYGISQAKICAVIGISEPTLRLYYAHELETAEAEANAAVAQSLFNMATKGKNVAAAIFWLKTRAGYREVTHLANAEDGQALIIGVVTGVERSAAHEDDRPRLSRPTAVRGVPRAS